MIDVNGVNPAAVPQPVASVASTHREQAAASPVAQDVIQISTAAKLAAMVRDIPDVRSDLVARVKAEIQAGQYETPERIERAVEGLMADLRIDITHQTNGSDSMWTGEGTT